MERCSYFVVGGDVNDCRFVREKNVIVNMIRGYGFI